MVSKSFSGSQHTTSTDHEEHSSPYRSIKASPKLQLDSPFRQATPLTIKKKNSFPTVEISRLFNGCCCASLVKELPILLPYPARDKQS